MTIATSPALVAATLLASVASLATGTPCPPDWQQSGSWCYLTNTSSSLSWAGAGALCQEHGGALVTIQDRRKLLDVVDLLKSLGSLPPPPPPPPPPPAAVRRSGRVRQPVQRLQVDPSQDSYDSVPVEVAIQPGVTTVESWWIGIQKTSGNTSFKNRSDTFDNYGEEKTIINASRIHQCVYLSATDGLWYWSECDSALRYVCQKQADRVNVDVVTPDRRRPAPAWFRTHGTSLEAALRDAADASMQTDDKGQFDPARATMTPLPPPTTTPVTAATPATDAPGPVTTTVSPCTDSWVSLSGSCHQLFINAMNWSMAEQLCQAKGGHLTEFDRQNSQEAFRRAYPLLNSGSLWIGLKRQSSSAAFHWTSGSQPVFSTWATGHPVSGTATQSYNCVALDMATNTWLTGDCAEMRAFSCSRAVDATERPPTAPTTHRPAIASACGGNGWWQFDSSCLLLVSNTPPVSWHQAERACRNRSATLVKIDSFALNNNIMTRLRGNTIDPVWIGLSRLGPQNTYRWTDGTNVGYTYWTAGGNSSKDMASCVQLDNSHGYWSTVNCNAPLPYVCQRPAGGGAPPPPPPPSPPVRSSCSPDWQPYGVDRCLLVSEQQKPWAEARRWCQDQAPDADLLSIPSAVHQAFLTSAVKTSANNLWISLTNDRLNGRRFLTWTDESAVNYTNWAPGQPSSLCDSCPDTCGVVDGRHTSTPAAWSDVDCTQSYGFICQRSATPNNSIDVTPTFCDSIGSQYTAAGDACYKIVADPKTWQEAADTCHNDGSALAYIADVFDNAELVQLLYRDGLNQYWLGLSDTVRHGMMEWTTPWPKTAAFLNWDPDYTRQPARDSCAVIVPSTGRWRHRSCSVDRRPFVCMYAPEREVAASPAGSCPAGQGWYPGAERCYRAFEPSQTEPGVNWTEAKSACEVQGHHLAIVSSVADFRAVRQAVDSLKYITAWIGLKSQQSSQYVWWDGSSLAYRAWYRREPIITPGCGVTSRLTNGRWTTYNCSYQTAYICMTAMDGTADGRKAAITAGGGGGGSGWGVFGVVVLVLALTAALAGVGLWYARRQRLSWLPVWLRGSSNAHHSVENLAYNRHHNALSSDRADGDNHDNGGLDTIAANRWGSQEQLVIREDL